MHILAYPCVARRAFVVLGCRMLPRCRPEGSFGISVPFIYEHSSLLEGRWSGGIHFFYEHLSLFEGRRGGGDILSTNIYPSSREGVVGEFIFYVKMSPGWVSPP